MPRAAARTVKDWDAICRDLSSGEDSDAHDGLNVMSVQKNAQRVAEIVRTVLPGLDADPAAPLMGMNRPTAFKDGLVDAIAAAAPPPPARLAAAAPSEAEETAAAAEASAPSADS
jgi:hypothetical protein